MKGETDAGTETLTHTHTYTHTGTVRFADRWKSDDQAKANVAKEQLQTHTNTHTHRNTLRQTRSGHMGHYSLRERDNCLSAVSLSAWSPAPNNKQQTKTKCVKMTSLLA